MSIADRGWHGPSGWPEPRYTRMHALASSRLVFSLVYTPRCARRVVVCVEATVILLKVVIRWCVWTSDDACAVVGMRENRLLYAMVALCPMCQHCNARSYSEARTRVPSLVLAMAA